MTRRKNSMRKLGGGFVAEYQAYLDAMDFYGYTKPTAPWQIIQNELFVYWIVNGVFPNIDECYIGVSSGDFNSMLCNIKQPLDRLVALDGNSSKVGNYLHCTAAIGDRFQSPYFYDDAVNRQIAPNDAFWLIQYEATTNLNSATRPIYINNGTNYFWNRPTAGTTTRLYFHNSSFNDITTGGNLTGSNIWKYYQRLPSPTNTIEFYEDGAFLSSYTRAFVSPLQNVKPLFMGMATDVPSTGVNIAIKASGKSMTSTQIGHFYTGWNNYLTAAALL